MLELQGLCIQAGAGRAPALTALAEALAVTRRAETVLGESGPAQNSSAFCVCLFLTVIYKPSKPAAHSWLPQTQGELHLTHVCPLCLPAQLDPGCQDRGRSHLV